MTNLLWIIRAAWVQLVAVTSLVISIALFIFHAPDALAGTLLGLSIPFSVAAAFISDEALNKYRFGPDNLRVHTDKNGYICLSELDPGRGPCIISKWRPDKADAASEVIDKWRSQRRTDAERLKRAKSIARQLNKRDSNPREQSSDLRQQYARGEIDIETFERKLTERLMS